MIWNRLGVLPFAVGLLLSMALSGCQSMLNSTKSTSINSFVVAIEVDKVNETENNAANDYINFWNLIEPATSVLNRYNW